uniref:Cysteine-rich DPF motif domain-containing protein 1 n=1 Tax=Elaeophora elaphi TaxID=1147741 RepID=A0A0R3RY62_9BILA
MDCAGGESSCANDSGHCDLKNDEDRNLIKFTCFLCGLTENCHYGLVEISGRTHTYRYKDEMYYMLDPFRNRSSVNERRLAQTKANNGSKASGNKAKSIFDVLVLGAICSICGQSVCIGEDCSIFYTKTFCVVCITREKSHFPKSFIEVFSFSKARQAIIYPYFLRGSAMFPTLSSIKLFKKPR